MKATLDVENKYIDTYVKHLALGMQVGKVKIPPHIRAEIQEHIRHIMIAKAQEAHPNIKAPFELAAHISDLLMSGAGDTKTHEAGTARILGAQISEFLWYQEQENQAVRDEAEHKQLSFLS